MGLETNPQVVDDLNEAWPAISEPAAEGQAHIRNIKKAVKARANASGRYGVTTLSSATDSDSEDVAATPAGVKAAKVRADEAFTKAEEVEALVGDFDTSVGENAVPVNGLWAVAAGDETQIEARHPQSLGEITSAGDGNRYAMYYKVNSADSTWKKLGSFISLNSGTFRLKPRYSRVNSANNGAVSFRVLKNGTQVWINSETKSDISAIEPSGSFIYPRTFSEDITCAAGDRFEFEFRFSSQESFSDTQFRLIQLQLCTSGAPLAGSLNMNPLAFSYFKTVGTSPFGLIYLQEVPESSEPPA